MADRLDAASSRCLATNPARLAMVLPRVRR